MTMKSVKNVKTFQVYFLYSKLESIIDDWHIFTRSYDETTKKLLVLSNDFVNMCQASFIVFTLLSKKHTSKVFTF